MSVITRGCELVNWVREKYPVRVWKYYSSQHGDLLAGGIAYAAVFSLFPALAVIFTVLAWALGRSPELLQRAVSAVNSAFGATIITTGSQSGGIVNADTLVRTTTLSLTGVIGLLGLLATGLGWAGAMRTGVQVMFGMDAGPNVAVGKLKDLGLLVLIGGGVALSAALGLGAATVTRSVGDALGFAEGAFTWVSVALVPRVVFVLLNVGVFLLLYRLVGGEHLPRWHRREAALIGSLGLLVVQLISSLLWNSVSRNAFLATSGVIIGIMLWCNLTARITLLSASWAATRTREATASKMRG